MTSITWTTTNRFCGVIDLKTYTLAKQNISQRSQL